MAQRNGLFDGLCLNLEWYASQDANGASDVVSRVKKGQSDFGITTMQRLLDGAADNDGGEDDVLGIAQIAQSSTWVLVAHKKSNRPDAGIDAADIEQLYSKTIIRGPDVSFIDFELKFWFLKKKTW